MNKIIQAFTLLIFISCNNTKTNQLDDSQSKPVENDSIILAKPSKAELLNKINLKDIKLECRGKGTRAASVYGSGVTIYFTITNNSQIGIKKVFFEGTYKFSGRSYVHTEEINYEFRRGLEPGETQKIAMRPGILSNWNKKIKPIDKGELDLNLISIENYKGERVK